MQGGAVPMRKYQLSLKKLIESGRANPGSIFDKEIRIEEAGKAYIEFSDHDFIKAVIRFGDDPEKLSK
jgi:threonine dehydrogenase-like Zn-dependent dehydrogenase